MHLTEFDLNKITHKIVEPHKRSIFVRFSNEVVRYFVQFPKTIFFETTKENLDLFCMAINDKEEICYMPFYNITEAGIVCLVYDNSKEIRDCKNLKGKINKFFAEPYKICGDHYSKSINKYLKLKIPGVVSVSVNPIYEPKIKEKLFTLYNNPIKLIPAKQIDVTKLHSLNLKHEKH